MSATRTQVYLTEEQRKLIDAVAHVEGITMAEVIRRALTVYLATPTDPSHALAATFGADTGAESPGRDEWDRG